jgi:hypothetical protein
MEEILIVNEHSLPVHKELIFLKLMRKPSVADDNR